MDIAIDTSGMDPCDVAFSVTNGVTTVYTYARHRDCDHCGHRLEDRVEGPRCAECVERMTRSLELRGRTYHGLTEYVLWYSRGRGRTYTRWFTVSHTVRCWRAQGLGGRVVAWYGGGACGPASALYLRDTGELWFFRERTGKGLVARMLGTVAGSTFTPDAALHLFTAAEYQESRRLSAEAAIARACFG